MKHRSPINLQPGSGASQERCYLKFNLLLLVAVLTASCGTADTTTAPSLSAAEPAQTSDSPFVAIPSGLNTQAPSPLTTPAPPASQQTDTPVPVVTPEGTAVPMVTSLPFIEPSAGPLGNPDPVAPVVTRAICTSTDSDMQQRMLQLINEARATERSCGSENFPAARALVWNTALADAAIRHSDDMATHNFFDHTGSDGSSASERVTDAGYQWRTVGENLAAGRETAAETLNDWLGSPGHCRNIMNPLFVEVAVACVVNNNSDYRRYWTNVLAAPM